MRIGEYLINENIITQEVLDEALIRQKQDKDLRLGDILVKMKKISLEELSKNVLIFMKKHSGEAIEDSSQWLSQEDVDKLSAQFFNSEKAE